MLYLHETIDITGTGQESYMQTVIERARHSEEQKISRLVGTFKVIGSTGRWPRVINLWEMDGWRHWAQTLERQFLPGKKDEALAPWWAKAAEWRSGGFDRILEPAPYTPTVEEMRGMGLKAGVCVQVITHIDNDRRGAYIEEVGKTLRPILTGEGLQLIGAYSVPMRSGEALTFWGAPDFLHLCRLFEGRGTHAALREWSHRTRSLHCRSRMIWIVPAEHSRLHP